MLGRYEILAPLGAGGMGEVYRAKDTRLERTVAIKVLPEALHHKPELRQRLELEARTISKLSHPNICTLHDVGQHGNINFLVLEFVEGKTLKELLPGSLPIRQTISIAVQIADGLAAAHELGIVHRDLKPENLMISCERVKILDFGLAKFARQDQETSEDCTTALLQTQAGEILGTIPYMSPEQVNGHPLDFRSDQFSFGLVLYEMITGRRAFRRDTPARTMFAIVGETPEPIGSLNPEAPPPLCWVVERCLAKEPEKRYASTRDMARDLAALNDRFSDLQLKQREVRPSNLPVPGTVFIGREKELAAARELLLRADVRLVTVTGPGGIGKSRLSIEAAREVAKEFSAGVYFILLGAVSEPGLIASAIAQTLGVRENGTLAQLEALKKYFENSLRKPMLLLLDNFEHLVEGAPLLAELLALAPTLKFLVTSRAALHIQDEFEFPVPPLALPDTKSLPPLEMLSQYSGISLFVQRAAAVKPGFKLTHNNASAVAEICARLDGLPLAIELAAARAKMLSPSAIRSRLESRLQLLTGGARDLPARQQTLRQTIDWSYDLLCDPEQKLFRRLSVFVGGCTLEAVESVCDTKDDLGMDILDCMASMVDKSLLRQIDQADGEPRFVMLETIREYALEKIAASGEELQTRRAHAAFCLVLAEEGAGEENAGANWSAWTERLELEHDNFRAALDWLIKTVEVDWGLRLGGALFHFWESGEYFREGRDLLGKLLILPGAELPTKPRLQVLFAAGVLAVAQGDYSAADALFKESLEIALHLQDQRSMAVAFNALAVNARDQGDLFSAFALLEESLKLWRELQNPPAVARALSNLANVASLQQEYPRASELYGECLSIFQELGDKTGIAWVLNNQGDLARDQCDFAAARSLYGQSLATFRELGDRWGIAGSLADLGNLAREQMEYHTAEKLFRESLGVFHELGHKRGIARLLESFACSAAAQSEQERALRLAGTAAALRNNLGTPLTPAEQGKLEKSLESARQGLTTTTGGTAWLEGWLMPTEKVLEELLNPNSKSA
jgi:predicted ATPase/tRNA A-37 threonylcarbamoyl transferase component Bud32